MFFSVLISILTLVTNKVVDVCNQVRLFGVLHLCVSCEKLYQVNAADMMNCSIMIDLLWALVSAYGMSLHLLLLLHHTCSVYGHFLKTFLLISHIQTLPYLISETGRLLPLFNAEAISVQPNVCPQL